MIWQSELFLQFPGVTHGSTSKSHGFLSYDEGINHDQVLADRVVLAESFRLDPMAVHLINQVHGNVVYKLVDEEPGNIDLARQTLPEADAIITRLPEQALVVQTADCVPIFFYAPRDGVVAVAHAGWKGTSKKIVQEVVKCFNSEYNIDSSGIICAIGPSICGRCYDVSTTNDGRIEHFDEKYDKRSGVLTRMNKNITLDLPEANRLQLLEVGILGNNIDMSNICTFEHNDDWASYRHSPDDLSKQIWSIISINR